MSKTCRKITGMLDMTFEVLDLSYLIAGVLSPASDMLLIKTALKGGQAQARLWRKRYPNVAVDCSASQIWLILTLHTNKYLQIFRVGRKRKLASFFVQVSLCNTLCEERESSPLVASKSVSYRHFKSVAKTFFLVHINLWWPIWWRPYCKLSFQASLWDERFLQNHGWPESARCQYKLLRIFSLLSLTLGSFYVAEASIL